jgi:hypothetical protein
MQNVCKQVDLFQRQRINELYLEYRELPSELKLKESFPTIDLVSFLAMHKGTIKRSTRLDLDLPSTCIINTSNHNNNNKQSPLSPHLIPILPIYFHVNSNNPPINPQSAFTNPSPTLLFSPNQLAHSPAFKSGAIVMSRGCAGLFPPLSLRWTRL